MIDKYLKGNNLIIVDANYKKKIVNYMNNLDKLVSYKVMTLTEFRNNYFYTYDKKTIYYVMKKYNTTVEIALEYLNSLYYIEDKKYDSFKLNELLKLKKELLNNNLLIFNPNFKYYLDHTNIIIYNCYLDPFYLDILSKYKYNIVKEENSKKNLEAIEFNSINDEIAFVCSSIKEKLDNGISLDNIKIISSGSEYINVLDRIFKWANIPLNIDNSINLYDLNIGKEIIGYLKDKLSFENIIEKLDIDTNTLNKIIAIFNEYSGLDIDNNILISMISYDLKHTFITKKHLNKAISLISLEEANDNDFVYLIGFNKENYPRIYKDEEFLSDGIKKELNLFTATDKNKNEKDKVRNLLYRNINYIITYKQKDSFNSYNESMLIKELDMDVIKNKNINYNFSNFFNKLKLISEYDNFYKYGTISDSLKLLNGNYNIDYDSYDNSFTGIDNKMFLSKIDKLTLSYSSLDNYFRCSFRYYINNILNIKEESKDEFYMNIGTIFHYVLSKYRENDFDFDKYWEEAASNYEFTLDKLVLLNKLKEELKYDIEIIKKQENYSKMDSFLFENRFSLKLDNDKGKDVKFTGVIDKIIYSKDTDKTLVSIIDYKTGTPHKDLSNTIYGIDMQLPIYLYLIKRSNLFPNSIIVGFYLQRIINKDVKATLNKSVDELKENALKLIGYSNCDTDYLKEFDMTYNDSSYIASLKAKNDGSFYNYSKVLNNDEIDNLDKIVSDNINKATSDILNGNFIINPKRIDNKDIGCDNCRFRDICFKKEKDFKKLDKHNGLDFLGGDNNA